MTPDELVRVPSVPECELDPAIVAQLPPTAPPAPWACVASAIVWSHLAPAAAQEALSPALRGMHARGVVGGFVRYHESPVGGYDEVFGNVGYLRGAQLRASVAFMAVDKPASLVGGRSNWSMPKTLATFEGEPRAGQTMRAIGTDWSVEVRPSTLGPALPIRRRLVCEQAWPDGSVRTCLMEMRGRGRVALVTVSVESRRSLAAWLRPGRHLGVVFETVEFTLSTAR